MLIGEIDVTNLMIGLPDHENLLRPLHEEERMNAMQIESGNADRPTGRLRGKAALAGKHDLVVLAQLLFRPGLQYGAVGIADGDRGLSPGPAKVLVGDMGAGGIPGDGTWAGRRLSVLGNHGNPADIGIGREGGRNRGGSR